MSPFSKRVTSDARPTFEKQPEHTEEGPYCLIEERGCPEELTPYL